jgi:hypothetical protein
MGGDLNDLTAQVPPPPSCPTQEEINMFDVVKYGHTLAASDEGLDAARETADTVNRWMNATPEERAGWAAKAKQRRAEERAAAIPVPLTLEALLARMERLGWSREYAEHLVQPYCECYDGRDGWEYCEHARDLGMNE